MKPYLKIMALFIWREQKLMFFVISSNSFVRSWTLSYCPIRKVVLVAPVEGTANKICNHFLIVGAVEEE
jgi:hypothetical protein